MLKGEKCELNMLPLQQLPSHVMSRGTKGASFLVHKGTSCSFQSDHQACHTSGQWHDVFTVEWGALFLTSFLVEACRPGDHFSGAGGEGIASSL